MYEKNSADEAYGQRTKSVGEILAATAVEERRKAEYRPLFLNPVAAGFPSPAEDYIERRLDLNAHLVRNPVSTYFVRAQGDSMLGAGIHDADILVVDRSLTPVHNRIVIAAVHGELTVKRLYMRDSLIVLMPENPAYSPLDVTTLEQFEVWGVVTAVIHKL